MRLNGLSGDKINANGQAEGHYVTDVPIVCAPGSLQDSGHQAEYDYVTRQELFFSEPPSPPSTILLLAVSLDQSV